MTELATIKVPRVVRDRVRDAARAEHMTQGQLIDEMLRQRRKAEFWSALEAESSDQEYLDSLDEADAAFAVDTESAISRFEADTWFAIPSVAISPGQTWTQQLAASRPKIAPGSFSQSHRCTKHADW